MRVPRKVRQRHHLRPLVQCRVAGAGKKTARESAVEVKALLFIAGNQAHRDSITALLVSDDPAVHSTYRLKVCVKRGGFQTQATGALPVEFNAKRSTHHPVSGSVNAKKIVIADQLGAVHHGGRQVKAFHEGHGNLQSATGEAVDELALRAITEMTHVELHFSELEMGQVTREIDVRRPCSQRAEPQRLVLKTRTRKIELCLAAENPIAGFVL